MVRIRVKVLDHDGDSKKGKVSKCICAANALVYKIRENRDGFILVTDSQGMDLLLEEESRKRFQDEGLDIQFPPEYETSRTVILRNVDSLIHEMPEEEIKDTIESQYKVRRVVKFPNNKYLLKIIFVTVEAADIATKRGISVGFQKFIGKNIDKEIFVPIVPCYRCYKYDHQRKNCSKTSDYLICSNCSKEGHTYEHCISDVVRCINCKGSHRTLAASCPMRKEIVRNKIRERRDNEKNKTQGDRVERAEPKLPKLPGNYLAVMAAAITLAEKREIEIPGIYQYIMNEMLAANNIPKVKFPLSVVSGYKDKGQTTGDQRDRKRMRSSTDAAILDDDDLEEEQAEEKDSMDLEGGEQEIYIEHRSKITPDGRLFFSTDTDFSAATPAPTPSVTPSVTPAVTPAPTPTATPSASPKRELKKEAKKPKIQEKPKEAKPREQPGIVVVVRADFVVPEGMTSKQFRKEVFKERIMKYVYTNRKYQPFEVREYIDTGKCDIARIRRIYVALEYFKQLRTGGCYREEQLVEIQRT